jgi:hypothetical protein
MTRVFRDRVRLRSLDIYRTIWGYATVNLAPRARCTYSREIDAENIRAGNRLARRRGRKRVAGQRRSKSVCTIGEIQNRISTGAVCLHAARSRSGISNSCAWDTDIT